MFVELTSLCSYLNRLIDKYSNELAYLENDNYDDIVMQHHLKGKIQALWKLKNYLKNEYDMEECDDS